MANSVNTPARSALSIEGMLLLDNYTKVYGYAVPNTQECANNICAELNERGIFKGRVQKLLDRWVVVATR